eukprot:gene23393-29852_t
MPLGDLDQVAAGIVEDRCRDRAEMDRRLGEGDAQTRKPPILGMDVRDAER